MSIYFTDEELDKLNSELSALLKWEGDDLEGDEFDYPILIKIRAKVNKEQIRRQRANKNENNFATHS